MLAVDFAVNGSGVTIAKDLEALAGALRVVAAEPDDQLEALETFRIAATQLRDGVRDLVPLDRRLARSGALPERAAALIRELDACFDRMLDAGDAMFTEEALRNAPEWAQARDVARRALRALSQ